MIASVLTLGLLGLAAAAPATVKSQATPHYPETSKSNGFHLVVNVTDGSKDFSPSIQNTYVSSIHVGAGLALVGNIASPSNARIFYQNGTADEHRYRKTTVITDSGTPSFPSGIKLVRDKGSDAVSTAHLDAGPGTSGIGLTGFPEPYVFLNPETWLACNESIPYYQNKYFIIFKQANTTVGKDGGINRNVPKDCAPVRLIPECTKLNDLPSGSYSSHDFAIEDRCYGDVKLIKWSEYGP
ncbi:hypothetical protein HRG_003246 [Hirsutella rhossiliensis]|uniref:DUF7907 domain-containing protein n=1 Tax=Hirsutella rhossiliensis TaxID=111463 RepID=A0A9P8N1L6_9HYPO|nr:uncharacterized protein HRG_03246 [Hirsutella rhossiliensis]KAH0965230.1 hypothetical protein HRG_03246 [Hirsutella rhossiliensis]